MDLGMVSDMEDKEAQEKIIASVLLEETMRSEVAADMVAKRIRQRLDACCTPILTPEEEAKGYKLAVVDEKAEFYKVDKREVGEYLKEELGFSDILIGCMRYDVAKYINKKLKAGFTAKIVRVI